MGKKNQIRKISNNKIKNQNKSLSEKDKLIDNNNTTESNDNRKSNNGAILTRMESKINTIAPKAWEIDFEDVPVFTSCPFCNQKIVTKTHFDKKKTICLCCCVCHPTMPFIFKDVIHSCPKCNEEIASYNRFLFCFRGLKSKKIKARQKLTKDFEYAYEKLEEETDDKQKERYSHSKRNVEGEVGSRNNGNDGDGNDGDGNDGDVNDGDVNEIDGNDGELQSNVVNVFEENRFVLSSKTNQKEKPGDEVSKIAVADVIQGRRTSDYESDFIEMDSFAARKTRHSSTSGLSSNSETKSPEKKKKPIKRKLFFKSRKISST